MLLWWHLAPGAGSPVGSWSHAKVTPTPSDAVLNIVGKQELAVMAVVYDVERVWDQDTKPRQTIILVDNIRNIVALTLWEESTRTPDNAEGTVVLISQLEVRDSRGKRGLTSAPATHVTKVTHEDPKAAALKTWGDSEAATQEFEELMLPASFE